MSEINNYFSNNNIFNGTEIPTQGKFDVGDIIVNIGENAEEEPMWMCIEAGEPGVWKVIGKVEEIDLSGYQEKTDENLVTESKDLVGAINELFQSANNGKELIANAIGEPVSAYDTFSAMSNDINGLLSTFKTNMMNGGVTVESGDKFKQLIDKISTMVEEGNGKGIQYAEGTFNITIINNYNYDIVIDTNLDFNPTLLFLTCGPNVICSNIHNSQNNMVYFGGDTSAVYIYSFDSSSIILRGMTYKDAYNVSRTGTWYAIGVGEEDTTLRDSLASILQEEGVSVTEEDDMASLITKVDEEFDRKNEEMENNKGLDIISATELPDTGKENQICIISNNPDKNIILTPNSSEAITDTSFVVISSGSGTAISVPNGNLTTHYYISEVRDNVNLLSSYYWSNNEWEKLTGAMNALLKNGTFYNDSIHGGLTSGSRASYTAGTGIMLRSYYYSEDAWSYMFTYATLNTQINLSLYNKIELDLQLESGAPNYNTNFNLYKSSMTTNKEYSQSGGTPSGMTFIQGTTITLKPNEITTISFDLTGHNDITYLCFNHIIGYNVFIKGIRLYHN